MGKRVKQDAPEYMVSQNPAKKHPDKLIDRLSRAKWSCWLKRVLGDEVDRCLQQAWGSDEEWDGADNQQEPPHRYCTDHGTIELTRLALCDLQVRISPMHLLTDLLEQRPDIDAGEYFTSTNPKNRHCDTTRTQCAMRVVYTNAMSALAFCSKCIDTDHMLTPMRHVDKSSPSGRHFRYG